MVSYIKNPTNPITSIIKIPIRIIVVVRGGSLKYDSADSRSFDYNNQRFNGLGTRIVLCKISSKTLLTQ